MRKLFWFLMIFMIAISCNREEALPKMGTVKFQFGLGSSGGRTKDHQLRPNAIVLTITDESGAIVEQDEHLKLFSFGDSYMSESLELAPGDYLLTSFLVLDTGNNVVYATPLEGSDEAHYVNDPLPISFSVTESGNSLVAPQVLLVTEATDPESFGYASFQLDVVNRSQGSLIGFVTDPPDNSGGRIKDLVTGYCKILPTGELEPIPDDFFYTDPYFLTNYADFHNYRFDGTSQRLYCTTSTFGTQSCSIVSTNYDGTGLKILYQQNDGRNMDNLLIDPKHGKIYWTSGKYVGYNWVQDFYSASIEGDPVSIQHIGSNIAASAVHTETGDLYSLLRTNASGSISVRDFSNLNEESLLFEIQYVEDEEIGIQGEQGCFPTSINLDLSRNKLYVKTASSKILVGNLDGTGTLEEIYRAPIVFPDDPQYLRYRYVIVEPPVLDKNDNKLYWSEEAPFPSYNNDYRLNRLICLDLNSGVAKELIPEWYGYIFWADNW